MLLWILSEKMATFTIAIGKNGLSVIPAMGTESNLFSPPKKEIVIEFAVPSQLGPFIYRKIQISWHIMNCLKSLYIFQIYSFIYSFAINQGGKLCMCLFDVILQIAFFIVFNWAKFSLKGSETFMQ